MQINPSEVTKILKEQIKKFGEKAEVSEVGTSVVSWRWYCTRLWIRQCSSWGNG